MRLFDLILAALAIVLILISKHLGSATDAASAIGNPVTTLEWPGRTIILVWSLIVFFFYFFRFNTWGTKTPEEFSNSTPRDCTTFSRFLLCQLIYSTAGTAIFLLFCFMPSLIIHLDFLLMHDLSATGLGAFKDPALDVRVHPLEWIASRQPHEVAPYAAIVMMAVIPNLTVFKEEWVRLFFQERAAIPTEAQRLIAEFDASPDYFVAEPDTIRKIIDTRAPYLAERSFTSDNKTTKNMAIVEYVCFQIERESSLGFVKARNRSDFSAFAEELSVFRESIIKTFERLRDLFGSQATDIDDFYEILRDEKDPRLKAAMEVALEQFDELKLALARKERAAIRLAVTLTLASARSGTEQRNLLRKLGIQLTPRAPLVPKMSLVFTFVVVLVVTALCIIFYVRFLDILSNIATFFAEKPATSTIKEIRDSIYVPNSVNSTLTWSMIGAGMNMFAVFAGLLAWRLFGVPHDHNKDDIRFVDYADCFFHGAVSAFTACVLFYFILSIFIFDERFILLVWPWAMTAGVTGGFLCVQGINARFDFVGRGVATAFVQGGFAVAIGLIVCLIWNEWYLSADPAAEVFTLFVATWSFFNGLALGLLAMYYMRPTYQEVSDVQRFVPQSAISEARQ